MYEICEYTHGKNHVIFTISTKIHTHLSNIKTTKRKFFNISEYRSKMVGTLLLTSLLVNELIQLI